MRHEHYDHGHGTCTVMMSFLLGGLAGAAVALLMAPQSGEETRRRLGEFRDDVKDRADEYLHEAREKVDDAIERGKDMAHDAREKVDDTVERGKEYYEEKKSVIASAIEAGKQAYKKEKGKKTS
jgi:gas vesicle protein